MSKKVIGFPEDVPVSSGWRAGDFIFVSGQVPTDENGNVVSGGIERETETVIRKIEKVLKQENASLSNVVKTTVLLTDMKDFQEMNQVYRRFFSKEPPARWCVQISALALDAKVEIDAIAYVPEKLHGTAH
jgi:reactive intermediate/imine deaminase